MLYSRPMLVIHFMYLFFKILFVYLFLAMLGLPCCKGLSLAAASRGYSLAAKSWLLNGVAFLATDHGFWECRLQWLWHMGSVVMAIEHRFSSCSTHSLALRHVGSSWIRDRIHVFFVGRWVPIHWTTREARLSILNLAVCASPSQTL